MSVVERVGEDPSDNETVYIVGDHLGSASLALKPDGAAAASARYLPFGEERWEEVDLPSDRGFTGQRAEKGFGLMDFKARFYSPHLLLFISPDLLVPDPYNALDWNRYLYVRGNPVNATDPTGHAMKLDDDGNTHECPANTCYIVKIGSTPGLPYYPISPTTYGENIMNTSAGGGSMDAGVNSLPDVTDKNFTIKNLTFREPSGWAGGVLVASDLAAQIRNGLVEIEPSRIYVFAFYKVKNGSINIKSLDVQNPTGADVSVKGVNFLSSRGGYSAQPGPGICPVEGYFGFPPVVESFSTTNVSLTPSGFSGNPVNSFPLNDRVTVYIFLLQTQTGMPYKWIQGIIPTGKEQK